MDKTVHYNFFSTTVHFQCKHTGMQQKCSDLLSPPFSLITLHILQQLQEIQEKALKTELLKLLCPEISIYVHVYVEVLLMCRFAPSVNKTFQAALIFLGVKQY